MRKEGEGGGGDGTGVGVDIKRGVCGVAILGDGEPVEVGGRGVGFGRRAGKPVGLVRFRREVRDQRRGKRVGGQDTLSVFSLLARGVECKGARMEIAAAIWMAPFGSGRGGRCQLLVESICSARTPAFR